MQLIRNHYKKGFVITEVETSHQDEEEFLMLPLTPRQLMHEYLLAASMYLWQEKCYKSIFLSMDVL